MKKSPTLVLMLAFLLGMAFTACNSSDDDGYTYTNDCLISAVTLGKLPCTIHTKNSKGEDSTYTYTLTGSLYPMSIDQVGNRIFNLDSLPVGINAQKIVFSTFTASNTTSIKSLSTGNDTIFSASDSTDFRQPRTITVYSSDGTQKRDYTIEVRVHKEEADTFVWQCMAESALSPLASFVESRALVADGQLYVYGRLTDGRRQLVTTATTAPNFNEAADVAEADGTPIDVRSVQHLGGTFYALAGGLLVASANGTDGWTAVNTPFVPDALAGTGCDSLYALSGGKIYSTANGSTWTESPCEEGQALPSTHVAMTEQSRATDPTMKSLILIGENGGETEVWRKDVDLKGNYSYPWMSLPQTEELGDYACPTLPQPALLPYDNHCLLLGLGSDGTVSPFYVSRDNGRTWKTGEVSHPALTGAASLAAAVDADNFIWLICGGTGIVYKGRLNRLGWDETPTRYEKNPRRGGFTK